MFLPALDIVLGLDTSTTVLAGALDPALVFVLVGVACVSLLVTGGLDSFLVEVGVATGVGSLLLLDDLADESEEGAGDETAEPPLLVLLVGVAVSLDVDGLGILLPLDDRGDGFFLDTT